MYLNSHIFKILVSFCLGIILIYIFPIHWVVLFTLWATSIIALLTLVHFGRQLIQFRKWIGVNLLLVFFLSGAFSYQYSLPSSQRKHFSHYFLQGDHIYGTTIEANQDSIGYRKVLIEVNAVFKGDKNFNTVGKLLCYVKSNENIKEGDIIEARPKINRVTNDNNPGGFDAESYWKTKGIEHLSFLRGHNLKIVRGARESSFWLGVRERFKKILEQFLSSENKQVAQALVLGDKSELSQEKRNEYASAGAMHVLAVSGMHVGILLAFLQWFFYRIKWIRKRGYFIVAALIMLWCFALLTGLSASVLRATIMFTVLSIGQLRGYSFFSLNALFVAAFAILFIDPKALFSIGFQLSFLAMLGIAFFFGPIRSLINSRSRIVNYFWDGTALGISAQIGTIPISLYYFHQFPNYFIITNIGLLVMSSIALISVVVFLIFCFVPYLVDVLSWIVNFIFHCLTVFIAWIDRLPFSVSTGFSPSLTHVLFMYIFIGLVYYAWQNGNVRMLKVGSVVLFLLGILLIYNREIIKTEDTLIVLNDSNKSVLVKEDGMLYFIHQKDADITQKSIHYLISGYEKSVGLHADIISLSQNKAVNISPQIRIKNTHNGWRMKYFDQHLLLANRLPKTKESSSLKLVKGKWNRFINNEKVDYNTTNKALQIYPTYK